MNKKVIFCLIILSAIVLILGLHGGSEYYFRDFCVHKALNMFYHNGSPAFFKKPGLVSDLYAVAYGIFYLFLKKSQIVSNFDEFVRYFSLNYIQTPTSRISYMTPALIINNIFAVIGVCFTFLTTYLLTNKKILPSFFAGFMLVTSSIWMGLSHHLAVDIPLSALCITVIFYSLYFVKNKGKYTRKELLILGLLVGLCTSAKYNGLLAGVAPLSVLFFTQKDKRDLFFDFLIFITGIFWAFYITNIYIFADLGTFYYDFNSEFNHAFYAGHASSDAENPILFHIFHSFPNAIGAIPFLCGISGAVLLFKNKELKNKYKLTILSFPIVFIIMLSLSVLIFLRYLLPIIPLFAIFIGYFVYYFTEIYDCNKLRRRFIYICVIALLSINTCKAIDFYNVMSTQDTRIGIKEIFKTLNISKKDKISYTDIFSNPYYNEDFLGKYSKLKDDIVRYLYGTNYTSIYVVPGMGGKDVFNEYSIIIFDSNTWDKYIQIRRDEKYDTVEMQYFMYKPLRFGRKYVFFPKEQFYVAQINPYKVDKAIVPFNLLRNDMKYRHQRGPFVEIYFKNKDLRDEFVKKCPQYSLKCQCLEMEEGYYYINYINFSLHR